MAAMNTEDVIEMLKKKQGGRSLRDFARVVNCSHGYLYDLYKGSRDPGNKIMKFLGLKKKRVTETTYAKSSAK